MLSVDSKVKELKKSPEACKIICDYAPGFETDPQMKLVQGLTMRKLASFPQAGLTPEQVEEMDARLRALGD